MDSISRLNTKANFDEGAFSREKATKNRWFSPGKSIADNLTSEARHEDGVCSSEEENSSPVTKRKYDAAKCEKLLFGECAFLQDLQKILQQLFQFSQVCEIQ